ncbi:uncharacterized protein LOC110182705 [Drosophila serrata]|uniref:uncharacterized protein LOC110182705 n=1 Tax=Drosophila serrata TaxID=7274 RepID=UPI000A1D3448|nr:uncharacterized protein LOC110182705 [Drosophila serrata]
MDDGELVKLIESHKILYDKDSARSVKNAALKDAAWKAISLKMGASERACITRWKSIRDRFGKEFRRFQERPDEPTYWDMFPRLLFLKDHYKQGLVKNECLDGMRFATREQRRRPKADAEPDKRRRGEEEEEDCQDDLLNEQLIELVKMHPVLYDRHKIRVSKNLAAKNEAWRKISENLNVSEELCYNRWKKLRDRFAREYRNQQINQATPITWRYYKELLFLGRHFRKGVPLILENIKRRGRPPKSTNSPCNPAKQGTVMEISSGEQIWGADYPYSTDNDDMEDELELPYDDSQEIEIISEAEQTTPYDFILTEATQSQVLEPPQQLQVTTTTPAMSEEMVHTLDRSHPTGEELSSLVDDFPPTATADKLLSTVIANMETVLQQSRELQVQIQQDQLDQEKERRSAGPENSLLAKAQMLLDGLSPLERSNAERKIVQFLCQCQIKALDGEDIEDVAPCQLFN